MSSFAKGMLLVCIPVIPALVYYAPVLTSLGWHLVHGNTVHYRGLRIEVPLGWVADTLTLQDDLPDNPQGITLQKPPRTLNIEARGPELVYINVLLSDTGHPPQQQAAEWQDLFRTSHPATEFDMAEIDTGLPPGASCLVATARNARSSVALACASIPGAWLATYAGSQKDVSQFLKVVHGLVRSSERT